jgi:hypothetical protein
MTTASALQALEATKGIEPIVAWRTWALTGHRDGTNLLLRPVAGRSRPWRPMQVAEAGCKHTRLHASPSLGCTCGLHGTHGLDLLRRQDNLGVVTVGDKRKNVAGRELINQTHRCLTRLFDFRPGHGAGAVQNDG